VPVHISPRKQHEDQKLSERGGRNNAPTKQLVKKSDLGAEGETYEGLGGNTVWKKGARRRDRGGGHGEMRGAIGGNSTVERACLKFEGGERGDASGKQRQLSAVERRKNNR